MTDYETVCGRLGFNAKVEFVKVHEDGSISFTAGKPDEILDLLAQVRRCGMRPHRQLLAAVRRISPRNTFLNATGS
jgi:hypothetical protein